MVWLDYPLRVSMWRLFLISLRRSLTKEELWNGNRERLATQFLSRDSLFLWALKIHRRRRRLYSSLFESGEYAHLNVERLRSPEVAERWLSSVDPATGG